MMGAYSSIRNISRRAIINRPLQYQQQQQLLSSISPTSSSSIGGVRSFVVCSRTQQRGDDNNNNRKKEHPSTLDTAATTTTLSSSSWNRTPTSSIISIRKKNYHSSAFPSKEYPIHTLLPFPALSPTMEMGTISKWELGVGDSFSAGSVLCSIETDKATMDFEAQDDGIIAKILKEGPDAVDLPIGSPIAIIVDDINDVPAFDDYVLLETSSADDTAVAAPVTSSATAAAVPTSPSAVVVVSGLSRTSVLLPSARFLAESKYVYYFVGMDHFWGVCFKCSLFVVAMHAHSIMCTYTLLIHTVNPFLCLCYVLYRRGLDATGLTGSGKGGRVTKSDVMAAIRDGTPMPALSVHETVKASTPPPPVPKAVTAAAAAAVPAAATSSTIMTDLPLPPVDTYGTFDDVANNNMRKVIARRLTESKRGVPHYYTSVEVELDNVMKLRKVLVNDHGIKISVNDVIIKCCSLALRDVPEVNGTYDPKTDAVKLQDTIDVSVAVATPTGLITPIVPQTDKLGLAEITDKVRDLATRARDGKLKPEEYQGGTFCVSNLGMFGIDEFSAVINPPQAAILAVGGGSRKVVPTPYIDGVDVQKKPSIKTIMTARLSADRRVVDEATASLFMSAFKHYITKPELLLL